MKRGVVWPKTREPLEPRDAWCVHCGALIQAKTTRRLVCSPRCGMARWRACVMLDGTHEWRDGRLTRRGGVAMTGATQGGMD